MEIKTYEKTAKTVEVVLFEGGYQNAMEICKWLGSGSSYIPPTTVDPRQYVQVPTMFGPRDCKPGHYIVKIGPEDYLIYRPEALDAEYRNVSDGEHPLVQHARAELSRFPNEDIDFKESLVNAVKGFVSYRGHSGNSAEIAVHMIAALLRGENLMPLTDAPEEWVLHSAGQYGTEIDMWQNKRNSKAISEDGGKTYFLVDDNHEEDPDDPERVKVKYYESEQHDAEVEIDPEDLKGE